MSSISLPAPDVAILARISAKLEIFWPFIAVITSPAFKPAFSAAEFGMTSLTNAPCCALTLKAFAKSAFNSPPLIPSKPRRTSPNSKICWTRLLAWLLGIAKAIPALPPLGEIIAVLIPINSPCKFNNAPPELPRFTAASVWI